MQRGLKIDENAENATSQEVIKAGLIGFTSGAILSGAGTSISNASNYNRGKKVIAEGKADTLIKQATQLSESVADSDDMKFVAEPLKGLTASLTAYNDTKKQTSPKATMLLGEIQKNVAYVVTGKGVQYSYKNIVENAESVANTEYFKQNYGKYTVEDIKANKDGITTSLAIADFAGQEIKSVAEYTGEMESGNMQNGISDFQNWQSKIDKATAESLSSLYGVDVKNGTYEEVREAVRNKVARAEAQAESGTNAAEGQTAAATVLENIVDKAETEPKPDYRKSLNIIPLPKKVSLSNGETALYRLKNGDLVGIKKTAEGYKIAIDKTDGSGEKKILSKAFPESELKAVLARLNGETGKANKSVSREIAKKEKEPTAKKSVSAAMAKKATETATKTEVAKTEDTKATAEVDTSDTGKKGAKKKPTAENKTEKKAEAKPKEEAKKEAKPKTKDTEPPKQSSEKDTNTEAKTQEQTKTTDKAKSQTAKPSNAALKKARKALASLSKNDARLKGGYVQDGKQYLCNGLYVVAFNDIDTDIETAPESYPIQRLSDYLNQVKENATEKDLVAIDLAALKETLPAKQSEMDEVNAKLGNGFYRATLVSKVLSAFDKPKCYSVRFKLNGGSKDTDILYIKADNGEGLVLGLRYTSDTKDIIDEGTKYFADYVVQRKEIEAVEPKKKTVEEAEQTVTTKNRTGKKISPLYTKYLEYEAKHNQNI